MSKKAVFLTKCFVLDAESKKVVFFKKKFWTQNFPKFSALEGNSIFLVNFRTLKNDKSLWYWEETDPNCHFWYLRKPWSRNIRSRIGKRWSNMQLHWCYFEQSKTKNQILLRNLFIKTFTVGIWLLENVLFMTKEVNFATNSSKL